MFDPFASLIAFTPLLIYLFAIAIVRLRGRAFVTTGGADTAAVLVAISGLIVVGPMELFFPKATAFLLGPWVWIPLLLLYLLFGCLLIINGRPRLVVYGRTSEVLFDALSLAAESIDPSTRSDPETGQVHLPTVGVHLRIDAAPEHDCVNVVAFEPMLSPTFWRAIRMKLRSELRETSAPSPRRGWTVLALAILMTGWLVKYVASQPQLLVDGFQDWLVR